MSETTTTTTSAARAANKAGKTIIDTVASAGEHTLPTVVETAEVALALDVPTKVVLNQRLIVIASVLGGAVLGAGVLYGVNRFRNRNKTVLVANEDGSVDEIKS